MGGLRDNQLDIEVCGDTLSQLAQYRQILHYLTSSISLIAAPPLLGDCREEILNRDVIQTIMKLLQSGHPEEILGGTNALCALATQSELTLFFLSLIQ